MAHDFGIDLNKEFERKMEQNEKSIRRKSKGRAYKIYGIIKIIEVGIVVLLWIK